MSFSLPSFRVGEGTRHEAASVFPLFSDRNVNSTYRLASEAIADGSVVVTELNGTGSVPELVVQNKGDGRVLFLEGEELVGAKQNRVLNASVLVAANSKINIPVSCVEQGRWRNCSRHFGHGGSHSSSKLRAIIRQSVSASARSQSGHGSDQGAVWKEIQNLQDEHGIQSPTSAMADVFAALEQRIADFKCQFQYATGANGLAIALGNRIVMLDAFDSPNTCEEIWDRILSGIAIDAMETNCDGDSVDSEDVQRFLTRAQSASLDKTDAVGEGCEYRGELANGEQATALVLDGAVIHGSVVSTV